MRQLHFIFALVIAVALASSARADMLRGPTAIEATNATACLHHDALHAGEVHTNGSSVADIVTGEIISRVLDSNRESLGSALSGEGEYVRPVLEIKGPPSSLVLFFSGLLTVGAFQALKSGKNLHLAHLPDWYHHGGPVQVGHATPFDLDFSNLQVCVFDVVNVEPETPLLQVWRDRAFDPHAGPQCLLSSLADPRGPPSTF